MRMWAKGLGAWLLAACTALQAQEWKPAGTVEFVVPAGPGGAADTYARALGRVLEKQGLLNGQAYIASNRPSGNGAIALQALQQKSGNPHLLTLLHTGITIATLTGDLKMASVDFTQAALFLRETMAVAVRADSRLAGARDLVAELRRDPASLRFGYTGHHVLLSLAKPLKAAGVDIARLTLVPYRSSAEGVTALMGGHVDVVPASTPNLVGLLGAGKVRLLAVSAPERLGGAFAAVPTWREQGVDASFNSVYGILLPKGVPAESVRFWEGALRRVAADADWQALLERNGAVGVTMDQAQTDAHFERERAELAPLVRELGLGGR